ncbi:c-type cytochrome [Massilia niastensis]|uniref:c-type cytochrome n=1 Tax=Massilia niastensis TaxID=544911 RepID=UPI0012EBD5B5|nr:c-type cytochrome [Massilia niastensis]
MRSPTTPFHPCLQAFRAACALLCAALAAGCGKGEHGVRVPGGDPQRGLQLIRQYQCGACHAIPGVQGAGGDAGPSLEHIGRLSYIAGGIPNQPARMVRWLQHPPSLKPGTLMPALGLSEDEARHMAAYLYTLR